MLFLYLNSWSLLPSYQVSNLNTTSQKHAKTIMYKTLQNDMLFHRRVINQPLCWVCQDGYDRICVTTLFHEIWETNAHMSYVYIYIYYNGEWGYDSPKKGLYSRCSAVGSVHLLSIKMISRITI